MDDGPRPPIPATTSIAVLLALGLMVATLLSGPTGIHEGRVAPTTAGPSPAEGAAGPDARPRATPSADVAGPRHAGPSPTRGAAPAEGTVTRPTPPARPTRSSSRRPPRFLQVVARPGRARLPGPTCPRRTSTVLAVVDASSTVRGRVTWSPTRGAIRTTRLTLTADVLSGSVGPFLTPGRHQLKLTVVDADGLEAVHRTSVYVAPCRG